MKNKGKLKFDILIKAVCIYNALVFAWILISEISAMNLNKETIPYYGFIGAALLVYGLSTIGLWFYKFWAVIVQLFFYLFQSILIVSKHGNFQFIFTPHFFVNLRLNFPDGQMLVGFNLISLFLMLCLIAISFGFGNVIGSQNGVGSKS